MNGIRKFLKQAWRVFKKVFIVLFIAQLVYIILLRWINPPFTITQLVDRANGYTIRQQYVSLEKISPHMYLAVFAAEDSSFPNHFGFNPEKIKKAYQENKTRAKPKGASSISQQVAKNVFLWQGGGWFRKGLETYFTLMIELLWSKERILEIYLNVAETGSGIYGVEAAAQAYFHKKALTLTPIEAAMLAASLPNPKSKHYQVQPPSSYIVRKYPSIINRMCQLRERKKAVREFTY